jgi:hypothetical protein
MTTDCKPSPDAEGCSDEEFDRKRARAFSANSAALLVAAYRDWYGTEGPGVLTREALRHDIERLMHDAVKRAEDSVNALRVPVYNQWSDGFNQGIAASLDAFRMNAP